MTDKELKEIEERASYVSTAELPDIRSREIHDKAIEYLYQLVEDDIPALVAEVRDLKNALAYARQLLLNG